MMRMARCKVFFSQTLCAIVLHSLTPVTAQAVNATANVTVNATANVTVNATVGTEMYGGVVVDQTITMIGQGFYQDFMALWRDKEKIERFALSIHERPSARQGSQIWINFGEKRVFQAQLPSNRSRVRDLSQHAVEITYQQVIDADVQALLFRDLDLGPGEL